MEGLFQVYQGSGGDVQEMGHHLRLISDDLPGNCHPPVAVSFSLLM